MVALAAHTKLEWPFPYMANAILVSMTYYKASFLLCGVLAGIMKEKKLSVLVSMTIYNMMTESIKICGCSNWPVEGKNAIRAKQKQKQKQKNPRKQKSKIYIYCKYILKKYLCCVCVYTHAHTTHHSPCSKTWVAILMPSRMWLCHFCSEVLKAHPSPALALPSRVSSLRRWQPWG